MHLVKSEAMPTFSHVLGPFSDPAKFDTHICMHALLHYCISSASGRVHHARPSILCTCCTRGSVFLLWLSPTVEVNGMARATPATRLLPPLTNTPVELGLFKSCCHYCAKHSHFVTVPLVVLYKLNCVFTNLGSYIYLSPYIHV